MALHFPECFYKHILGKPTGMKDLASYSPALYRSMQYLLDPSRTADDMAIMNLPFELNQKPTQTGKRRHRYERDEPKRIRHDQGHGDLKTKLVDLANRFEYVEAYTQKLLFTDVKKQYQAFCKGFRKIIAKEPMPSLNHRELELLLCGSAAYDFADLRQFTRLALQYSEDHPVIKNFWEVLFELDSEDKKLFLQFVTGNCRLPVGGAAALRPHFTIHWVSSDLTMNLPCSHTCANILELPPYSNKETLQDKLLKAIRECGQFSFR